MAAPNVNTEFKDQAKSELEYQPKAGEIIIEGRFGFPGIDIGPAYIIDNSFKKPISQRTIKSQTEREDEVTKLDDAITKLTGVFERMTERSSTVAVEIRDVYEGLLVTETVMLNSAIRKLNNAKSRITDDGQTAEKVIYDVTKAEIEKNQELLKKSQTLNNSDLQLNYEKLISYNTYFQATLINFSRGHDLHSLDRIPGNIPHDQSPIPIAANFQVGDLAFLKDETGHGTKVHSLIRYEGSSGDHTEVIAKGLRIAVGNIEKSQLSRIKNGQAIVVDGRKGIIIVNPSQETLAEYKADIAHDIHMAKHFTGKSAKEAKPQTRDGVRFKIGGNIAFADEMYAINESNAAAVNLYRTEVAIKSRFDMGEKDLDVEKLTEIYNEAVKASFDRQGKAKSITFRTPDFEEDKDIDLNDEGKRELVEQSIKAMLIAKRDNPGANIHIMFPMIETAKLEDIQPGKEMRNFEYMRNLVHDLADEVGVEPPNTGAMIETKSAIKEMTKMDADFYSVGTNDLIPELLGYPRYKKTGQYDPTDPRVIEALQEIQQNAVAQGKENCLSVCGDLASDPRYFALLAGMGYTQLSSGPGEIPYHKELVRRINTKEAKMLVKALKRIPDRADREAFLDDFNEDIGLRKNRTLDENWEHPDDIVENAPEFDADDPAPHQ